MLPQSLGYKPQISQNGLTFSAVIHGFANIQLITFDFSGFETLVSIFFSGKVCEL